MKSCFMKSWLLAAAAVLVFAATPIHSHEQSYQPLWFHLECSGSDCPLLRGVPQTAGMRGGFVRLKPGQSVGEHSTQEHEEALVVLQGQGKAEVEGREAAPISSRMLVYIPPRSRHNVTNTGTEMLEYVYVVAPIASGK
jgi:mannose-6-phosphate isomerase-like protein (cupin superfamily)